MREQNINMYSTRERHVFRRIVAIMALGKVSGVTLSKIPEGQIVEN